MWRNPLGRICSIPPKLVQLPLEQCLWEVKMCAACRRGRVEPHRGLDAAEEFQPKLLLLLNSQMFVQGFDSENGPAILLMLLSSLNRQRFVGHRRSRFSKQWIEDSRKVHVPVEFLQSRVQQDQFVLILFPRIF
jgi:hypothetical protein